MTANPIRYNTNDARTLMRNTIDGLQANGVIAYGLGERRNGKLVYEAELILRHTRALSSPSIWVAT